MIQTRILLTFLIGVALPAAGDPPAAIPLNEVAAKLLSASRYAEAKDLYEDALRTRERTFGLDDPRLAPVLSRLGQLYQDLGDYDKAEASARRSISILESKGLQNTVASAVALNDLAVVCRLRDRLPEAESLSRRALEIFRNSSASEQAAAAMNNLAEVVSEQGKWKEARDLYLQAISVWQEALGPNRPEVAAGFSNLAFLYVSRHEYGRAATLLERAMKIDQAVYAPNHPRIALDLNNQAALVAQQKRYREAESLLLRALSALERSLPPGHPDIGITETNLAEVYRQERKYEDSERLYRTGLAALETSWGLHDRRLMPIFEHYAAVLRAREEYADAANVDLRAMRIRVVQTLRRPE